MVFNGCCRVFCTGKGEDMGQTILGILQREWHETRILGRGSWRTIRHEFSLLQTTNYLGSLGLQPTSTSTTETTKTNTMPDYGNLQLFITFAGRLSGRAASTDVSGKQNSLQSTGRRLGPEPAWIPRSNTSTVVNESRYS